MTILSIDHVQIAMPAGEEDKARRFYIEQLGFTEIPKPPDLARRGGAWFQTGNVQLHLGVEADFRPARKAHPAFIVDNLDALIENVQKAGYETDTSQPALDGYKRAHVFDPFGNRIELMEKISFAPHGVIMDMPFVTPWASSATPTQSALRQLMADERLSPYSWSNGPFDEYAAHSHAYNKVIYVVQGSIMFGLPELGKQLTLKAGDRLDLPAGVVHNAHVGAQGVVCLEAHKD